MSFARSSFSVPLREKTRTLMTVPSTPGGTRSEVSRTSPAFSPKIARRSFSSGESCVSPFGVFFPPKYHQALPQPQFSQSRSRQDLLALLHLHWEYLG